MGKAPIAALALLACTACTTLQPLPDTQPATVRQAVQPGDRVEIVKVDGSRLDLKVEEVGADFLRGVDQRARHRVAFAEIRTISTRVMTTRDKVWTAVGVAAVVGAVIAVAADGGGGGGGGGY